jgi:hypothetical protein
VSARHLPEDFTLRAQRAAIATKLSAAPPREIIVIFPPSHDLMFMFEFWLYLRHAKVEYGGIGP